MKHKKVWLITAGIIVFLMVIEVAASIFFYDLAIKRGPKDFLNDNEDLEVSEEAMDEFMEGDWIDWVNKQKFKEMTMTSRDGLKLKGYYLPAKRPTNKVVMLEHGYLGYAKQMGLYGKYYYEKLGYNIFMADARGHGESEGDYYGFGWQDRLDLIDWTKQLAERLGQDSEIVYHGLSMGAATVLMASGENLPGQVKAIVADSPYNSVYDLFAYQMKRMYHLPAFPFLDGTSVVTKIRAGYTLKEGSALEQVKKAEVPILYITGNADTFVPTNMTHELYKHTKSPARILTIDGANHGESYVLAKKKYLAALNNFLHDHVQ